MKTIIIAGMHRSGTSLITQWLNKCGLHVGTYCLGANQTNLDGHFEDLEFVRLHEDILKDNELPESGLTEHPIRYISDYNRQRFEDLFKCKNEFFTQWGWKDPRNCLFLRYYKNNFPDSKYLFIVRDYRSVVNSLLHRSFREVDKKYLSRGVVSRFIWLHFRRERRFKLFCKENAASYLKIWIAYNEQINSVLQTLSPKQYVLLSYPLLQSQGREAFDYLCENFNLDLNYVPFNQVYKHELISRMTDVEDFINDESLLNQAKDLQSLLHLRLLMQDIKAYIE